MPKDTLVGCFPDMSNEDYHSHKGSFSRSGIMDYKKSAYHYWAHHINPERPIRTTSDEMWFGTAFHTLMLEPDLFDEQFACKPVKPCKKDEDIEKYTSWDNEVKSLKGSNKHIFPESKMTCLNDMRKAILAHPVAAKMLSGSVNELSYFWEDEGSGLNIKCRPDALKDNYIIDLKTSKDASERGFQREMYDRGYYMQAAMCLDGVNKIEGTNIDRFYCIVVEKTYPFFIGIYLLDELAVEQGRKDYEQVLFRLKHSLDSDIWQYPSDVVLGLPAWAEITVL